jgi:hypothetical protein
MKIGKVVTFIFFLSVLSQLSQATTIELLSNYRTPQAVVGQGNIVAYGNIPNRIHPGPLAIQYSGSLYCVDSSEGALGISIYLITTFGEFPLRSASNYGYGQNIHFPVSSNFYFAGFVSEVNSSVSIQMRIATTGDLGQRPAYCTTPAVNLYDQHSATLTYSKPGREEEYFLSYQRPHYYGWLASVLFTASVVFFSLVFTSMTEKETKPNVDPTIIQVRLVNENVHERESTQQVVLDT